MLQSEGTRQPLPLVVSVVGFERSRAAQLGHSASERLLMTCCFLSWFSSICCTFVTALLAVSLVSASHMKPFQGLVCRSHPNSLSSNPVWWCWSRTVLSQETVSAPAGQRWCTSGFGRWRLSTGCIWLSLFIYFITSFLDKMIHSCLQLTFK